MFRTKLLAANSLRLFQNSSQEKTLIPYKNVYFDTSLRYDYLTHANVKLVRLLIWLTVVSILLFSKQPSVHTQQAQEFGIKQTLGARNLNVYPFIGEPFLQH